MSKIFLSFLIMIFSSFIPLSLEQSQTLEQFFNIPVDNNNENGNEENNCACDINRNYCNYLCCCDTKCKDYKDEWKKRLKCIDEKDTLGIFADRCIDKNLIYKYNKRRGLNMQKATEDITINENVIENECFSIDNYDKIKKEIKPLNLNKDEQENILNTIINEASSNRLRRLEENNSTINKTNTKDILYYYNSSGIDIINNGIFINTNGEFVLYSGEKCEPLSQVEILQSANYTCSMNILLSDELIKNIIRGINADSHQKKIYQIQNGILLVNEPSNNIDENNDIILEVEFILKNDKIELNKISNYSINIVKSSRTQFSNRNSISFKNSVIFSNDETKVPYRFSGTIEYITGNPLKVAINNSIYNEFYIIGKDNSGNCRTDNNINNYLYFDDKPILFNRDISYSCDYSNINNINDLTQLTLFNKLNSELMVGKYGNSYNNKEDWIKVENSLNSREINNTLIKMDIYLGTKNIGINSYKYIYKATLKNESNNKTKNNNTYLTLDINYYDLDAKKEYEITPELPAFVPSMPPDLLDPLIYSNVDK